MIRKPWDKKRGFGLMIGKLYPWFRHPWRRFQQERAILQTPGIQLRIPAADFTMLIFDYLEDARNCMQVMAWSGNPHDEEIMMLEYSLEEHKVWLHCYVDE